MSRAAGRGSLAIVLHAHMPYVHGYGTWPFGDEWLWEVHAGAYVPLTEMMDGGAPLTLSLTPVLGDQLEAPAAGDRLRAFLTETREGTHAEDRDGFSRLPGSDGELTALDHSVETYRRAADHLQRHGGDPLAALARHASWTSSATHAILPLLATQAGIRLQVGTGIASHRRRTGSWGGGFWLPECAWHPELERELVEEGVRTVCVELADGVSRAPWRTPDGLQIVPIDRQLIDLIWHPETSYPTHADYRDSNSRTWQGHHIWANSGAAYDPEAGARRAELDAASFADGCAAAIQDGASRIVAFDAELFGHWWHEGARFLELALGELGERGIDVLPLDELLDRQGELPMDSAPPPSTWGRGRDLRTWSGPVVATIAEELRRAELDLLAARRPGGVPDAALRDLLALQSSDWAFMVSEDRAPGYGWARFAEHRRATVRPAGSLPSSAPQLRHLAPDLATDALAVG